ncbi:hypothetical protein JW948_10540 [bacterium]|nr:hypothetical protein [bacterium]
MENQQASSDVIREEIRQQSLNEAEGILESARKEETRILAEAEKESGMIRDKALKNAGNDADSLKRKILSSVHLEVKKEQMKHRENVLKRMMTEIHKKLDEFRNHRDYPAFLRDSLIEAVLALNSDSVKVVAGVPEKKLLDKNLLEETMQKLKSAHGLNVEMILASETLNEGGVLVISGDGRTRYDNSFSAQLSRNEDETRLTIYKEVFQ